jgi:peptidoglycan hydrolase-like protein with peptidoglycan-binding domain
MKYWAIFLAFLMTIATHAWSNEVITLQKQLKALGYNPGSADGLWGGLTKNALKSFLSDQGQSYDGVLDSNEFQLVENELKKLKPTIKFQNINSSTERYLRTKLLCQIATVDKLKPFPTGIDDFRSAPEMSNYADLFGDGTIEFITGSWDSTIVLDTQKFPNQGNKKRATKPSEYLIYSPVKNFNLGLSLKFHNARILTSFKESRIIFCYHQMMVTS